MARISVSTPLLSSPASAQVCINGIVGSQNNTTISCSPAESELRRIVTGSTPTKRTKFFSKLLRRTPLWRVFSLNTPVVELLDSETKKAKENRIADVHLENTCFLRATPLSSLLLYEIAKAYDGAHAKICDQLLEPNNERAPQIFQKLAEELQAAISLRNIHASTENASTTSCGNLQLGTRRPLYIRRAERSIKDASYSFTMGDLAELNTIAAENDCTLLCHKKRENPDFPIIPIWHADYAAQRNELDVIVNLPEDSADGFFTHAMVVDIILDDLKLSEEAPDAQYFQETRKYAIEECEKIFAAEIVDAYAQEPHRLIRAKIECLLPKVGGTPKKDKALRFVSLKALEDANVLTLSDFQTKVLLKQEMNKVMNEEGEPASTDDICIGDIISTYSDDVDSDYWRQPQYVDIMCNDHKREYIANWASNVETPVAIHRALGSDDIFEANYDCEAIAWAEIALKSWPWGGQNGPMIAFELTADKKGVILPLAEDYPAEHSQGFFTNMSGLTGISSGTSSTDSVSNSDEEKEEEGDDSGSGSKTSTDQHRPSVETSHEDAKPDHTERKLQPGIHVKARNVRGEGPRTPRRPYADMKAQRLIKPYDKSQNYTLVSRSVLNKKVAAMADPEFIDTRRLDNLHRAWDVPHRAHGPHQPGMREHKEWHMIPPPDWEAPGVEKPAFAQREEATGPLSRLMHRVDALGDEDQAILLGKSRMDEAKGLGYFAIYPPRRPIYDPSPSGLPTPSPFFNTTFSGKVPEIFVEEDTEPACWTPENSPALYTSGHKRNAANGSRAAGTRRSFQFMSESDDTF